MDFTVSVASDSEILSSHIMVKHLKKHLEPVSPELSFHLGIAQKQGNKKKKSIP